MNAPPLSLQRRSNLLRGAAAGVFVLVIGAVAGCATSETGFVERPVYPAAKRQARSLDIQVFRDDTVIQFTNTTARTIPACTLWVNAWYSRDIPSVGVGESLELNLYDFKDQYGDAFRGGGFFATDRPTTLVLAQLEMEDELLGLLVIGEYE